jgi:uncharacterized membrane protein
VSAAAPPSHPGIRQQIAPHLASIGAVALTALASVGYATAAIYRHDHFGSNAYDLGIFDQIVWSYSRLEWMENTVLRLPHGLGDHFHPILVALAPLYWAWSDPRMLLVAQAVATAGAGIPLFLWARAQLGLAAAFLFQAAFLVFWAVLGGNIFDFHELALAAPILSVALYAALTRRTALLWTAAVLALLTREDLALVLLGLAAYIALAQRRWRLGAALAAVSTAWLVTALKLVIPAIANRDYAHWSYSALGSGPGSALGHLVAHPVDSIRLFFTPAEKRTALFNLFAPWLVLPLVSPLLVVALPALATRFWSDKPSHWAAQGFHYSLVIAPILAFAAVDTTRRLAERLPWSRMQVGAVTGALLLLAGVYFSFLRLKPLDELRRYTPASNRADIRDCLSVIPRDASVAATSALVPHLSQRRHVYAIDRRPVPRARYLAVNLDTWIFPRTVTDLRALVSRSLADGYGVACARGHTVVLAQGAPRRTLPAAFAG